MNFILENQGGNTFLTYELSPEEVLDKTTLGMITNNRIYGLAPAAYAQIEGKSVIKYNVSSRMQAKRLMTGKVSKKVLLGVFLSICRVFSEIDDYMIPASTVVLDLERIYVDVESYEAVLLCLPLEQENSEGEDLRTFFRNTMFSSVFDEGEDNSYVAEIISYLNGSSNFVIEQFEAIIRKASHSGPALKAQVPPAAVPAKAAPAVSGEAPAAKPAPEKAVRKDDQPAVKKPAPEHAAPFEFIRDKLPTFPSGGAEAAQPPVKDAPYQEPTFDGMMIPNMADFEDDTPALPEETASGESISLMYLLRHMDSETLALYKAQQAEKRKNKAAAPEKKPKKEKGKKKKQADDVPQMEMEPIFMPEAEDFAQPPVQRIVPETPVYPAEPARNTSGTAYFVPEQEAWQEKAPISMPETAFTPEVLADESGRVPYYQSDLEERTILGGNFIDISMLEDEGPKAVLIRKSTGERINLHKDVFQIGRSREESDYCIPENKRIGRRHAKIISRNEMYFVVDLESKNCTYINGEKIPSNVEVEIHSGDVLSIYTERFEFSVE